MILTFDQDTYAHLFKDLVEVPNCFSYLGPG